MKTRRFLALVLSLLMITSALATNTFAAPSAVTVSDSVHEHTHADEPDETAYLAEDTATLSFVDTGDRIYPPITLACGEAVPPIADPVKPGYKFVCWQPGFPETMPAEDLSLTAIWCEEGTTMYPLVIEMDAKEDYSWIQSYIEIYKDGELFDSITPTYGLLPYTYYAILDGACKYTFEWVDGMHSYECSFTIKANGEVVKTVEDASSLYNQSPFLVLESICEHSVSEPNGECPTCSKKCGTDFAHDFDASFKCKVCSFECGVTDNHDWSNEDGVCKVCDYKCSEHTFDESDRCTTCNFPDGIIITMNDASYDGWDASAIEVYIDNNFEMSLTVEESSNKVVIPYDEYSTYIFKWKKSEYDGECSFRITLGDEIDLNVDSAEHVENDETILEIKSKCEHSFSEPNGECLTCSRKCGTAFVHIFDASFKCKVCSFECGVTDNHDWSNDDGICKVCDYECPEHTYDESDRCTTCNVPLVITITMIDACDDGWNDAVIEVYIDNAFDRLLTVEIGLNKVIIPYDEYSTYMFKWKKGAFDSECSFRITLGNEVDFNVGSAENFKNDEIILEIESKCEHSVSEPKGECSICHRHCGEEVEHIFDETKKCLICSYECGVTSEHDWADGVCEICDYCCPGHTLDKNNICTICGFVYKINIYMTDSYGDSWNDAMIEIYKNGVLIATAAVDAGEYVSTYSLEYDKTAEYTFKWISGAFDNECAFTITLAGTVIKDVQTATYLPNGQIFCKIEASAPAGININIGEMQSEDNYRCVIINGVKDESDAAKAENYVIGGTLTENSLIEVVEKTADGEVVKTQYFYADKDDEAVTKLSMDSYMLADRNTSIRTNNPMGIRFKSSILTSVKDEEIDYIIDEYGFIVATQEALGDEELTLDFSKYVTGVAYNRENGTDIVFDTSNDEFHVFAGYLKNIPAINYKTNLVCKTYTKLTVDGQQFVVYGEEVVGNVYDTAMKLLETDPSNADLIKIVLEYEGAVGLPGDELYP